jgi:hypothetical protein
MRLMKLSAYGKYHDGRKLKLISANNFDQKEKEQRSFFAS